MGVTDLTLIHRDKLMGVLIQLLIQWMGVLIQVLIQEPERGSQD